MKNTMNISNVSVATGFVAMFAMGVAQADLQYRVAYDAETNEYAIYMTPDSVPSPDLALSAQVTLKIPQITSGNTFDVDNLQSEVAGIEWQLHSTVPGPVESPDADYLSFGMLVTGGAAPGFSWAPGEEKKIFSFNSTAGCRDGVALLENSDAFNQLPNSAGTNPGNQFTNLGWASANNYLGNYGRSVVCPTTEPVDPEVCAKVERKTARIDNRIEKVKEKLRRLEERKRKLQLRLDTLETKKDTLAAYCPA